MPSIKDIVAGQSVGVGKRVIKAGADKLRGIINDRTGGKMPSFGAFGMTKLTYPLDVVDDPQQGHYIVFTVREITKEAEASDNKASDKNNAVATTSKLAQTRGAFGKNILTKLMGGTSGGGVASIVSDVKSNVKKVAEQKIDNYDKGFKDIDKGKHQDNEQIRGKDEEGQGRGSRFRVRPATKRTSTMISLYMPPQVKNITGVNYKDQEMGTIATLAGSFADNLTDDEKSMLDIDTNFLQGGKVLGAIGSSLGAEGAAELSVLMRGKLFSPRMEFIFDAVKKRVFTYQFSFYPKSEQEAQEVGEIVKTFRKHMLPRKIEGASQDFLALHVPNEFNIEYYYKGNQNSFINQVGTSLLTDCDITYGGDRYGTFKPGETRDRLPGASPTETHMTLTFQEMDIITSEDVESGY